MAMIVHITADYPDPLRGRTTLAVKRLLDATPDFDHVVISLLRTMDPRKVKIADCGRIDGQRVFAYRYFGLPLGIGLGISMTWVAKTVLRLLREQALTPDLFHAHKLGWEGLATHRLSRILRVPFVVSVRGEAETKVLKFLPWLHNSLRQTLSGASHVFFVSAWCRPLLERLVAIPEAKSSLLPNIVTMRTAPEALATASSNGAAKRLISIADLNVYRKKGLPHLIAGFALLSAERKDVMLDIYGWAPKKVQAMLDKKAKALGVGDRVRFQGVISNDEILHTLPTYDAFVLPSVNETFGMSFLEAILSGVPILYVSGTGIDGYFDGQGVGVCIPERSPAAVARGLTDLLDNSETYRAAIARNMPTFRREFSMTEIAEQYRSTLKAAMTGKA